jgi:hypothetical protein
MARAASTYRGARRNFARETGTPMAPFLRMNAKRRKLETAPAPIYRPYQSRGWDWRRGGKQERLAALAKARAQRALNASWLKQLHAMLGIGT